MDVISPTLCSSQIRTLLLLPEHYVRKQLGPPCSVNGIFETFVTAAIRFNWLPESVDDPTKQQLVPFYIDELWSLIGEALRANITETLFVP